jgi:hypothetical protein
MKIQYLLVQIRKNKNVIESPSELANYLMSGISSHDLEDEVYQMHHDYCQDLHLLV